MCCAAGAEPPQYGRANPGMNASGQRAFSFLQTERAQFAAVFVARKHVGQTFFGDPKTAAMKILGR